MPTFENFICKVTDGTALLTINRPEVRNALNQDCWKELLAFVNWVDQEETIKTVIITGAGEKAFVAGADLTSVSALNSVSAVNSRSMSALKAITNSPKVFIAAVNGYAFGGGCELSLACDLRLASVNARFGLPETGLGLIPGAGGTQRLPRIVGIGVANEMILGGRTLTGEQAVNYGLAMKCVPLEELMPEAYQLAETVNQKGTLAVGYAKKCVRQALSIDENSGLVMENQAFAILMSSEDKKEGIAAFFEKRQAAFKNK